MDTSTQRCLDHFSELLRVLKSNNQYEKTLHLVVDRITRMYRCQTCAIVLVDPETEYLNVENSIGLSYTFCKAFRRKFAVGAVGEVLWTGKPVFIRDSLKEPKLSSEVKLEHPAGSCICVQLEVDHRTLGYLHVDSKEPNAFKNEDVILLQTFADVSAIAINKARLHDENLRLDTIDHDSGLEKYSAFVQKLSAGIESAKQFSEYIAVIILDVDNFKTIVNTYGHEKAMVFLRELGSLLRSKLRSIDASGRYGFDEFAAMLAKTDIEEGIAFAQSFCRTVEASAFVDSCISSTVSIGVAAYPQNGQTTEDILLTAKKALFEAQRAGRNNVFFYPAEWYASNSVLHH